MYAKLYGYSTGYQTLAMLSDLKLGACYGRIQNIVVDAPSRSIRQSPSESNFHRSVQRYYSWSEYVVSQSLALRIPTDNFIVFNYILYKSIVDAHRSDLQNRPSKFFATGQLMCDDIEQLLEHASGLGGTPKKSIQPQLPGGRSQQNYTAREICISRLVTQPYLSNLCPDTVCGRFRWDCCTDSSRLSLSTLCIAYSRSTCLRMYSCCNAQSEDRQWIWSYLNMPIILTYLGWLPYSVNGDVPSFELVESNITYLSFVQECGGLGSL